MGGLSSRCMDSNGVLLMPISWVADCQLCINDFLLRFCWRVRFSGRVVYCLVVFLGFERRCGQDIGVV